MHHSTGPKPRHLIGHFTCSSQIGSRPGEGKTNKQYNLMLARHRRHLSKAIQYMEKRQGYIVLCVYGPKPTTYYICLFYYYYQTQLCQRQQQKIPKVNLIDLSLKPPDSSFLWPPLPSNSSHLTVNSHLCTLTKSHSCFLYNTLCP